MRRDDFSDSELHWQRDHRIYQEPTEPPLWDISAIELLIGAIAIVAMVIFSIYYPGGFWQ